MKLLFVNPPIPTSSGNVTSAWYLREENHAAYDSTPMPPHFAPSVLGYVRQYFNDKIEIEIEIKVIDGLLTPVTPQQIQTIAIEWEATAAFVLLGVDIIEHDAAYAALPCPAFAQLCPVTIDPAEAISLYGLTIPYLIYGGETEVSLALALEELEKTGVVANTPGVYVNKPATPEMPGGFPTISDMITFPMPAYDLFDMASYLSVQIKNETRKHYHYSALVQTMKGCLFECVFCTCSSVGQQARYKTAQQVVDEIRLLKEKYGFYRFVFIDSEFGVNLNRAKDICRTIIHEGLSVSYVVNNRVDLVDEELLQLMKASGCEMVRYGVESADPRVLKAINKKIDISRAAKTIKMTRDVGIYVNLFFLVGLPAENEQTLRINADFIVSNHVDSFSLGRVFVIPNTALYKQLKEENKLLVKDWQTYRKNEQYLFSHNHYKNLGEVKKAERKLLNMINRQRLTTYASGSLNYRLYAFASSFDFVSFYVKNNFPYIYAKGKKLLQTLLNVRS
ncbi:MAG: radical SAM protein [Nitrospirae bacterium]|nr:radical SAM protein [Nitrospirota bacterium]